MKSASQRSRENLLDAATEVISERGLAAAGIGEICARAGIAKTSLYHHFGNRQGLLAAVIDRVGTLWVEEFQKSAYLEGTLLRRLDRILAAWKTLVVEKPHLLRFFLFVQLDQTSESEEIRRALAEAFQRTIQAVAAGIEDAVGTPIDGAEIVADTMVSLLVAAALRHEIDPPGTDLDALWGEMKRVVGLSLAARMPAGFDKDL
jgi:AcrR family transcriptional regulator